MTSAIILAGGLSSRMDDINKLLLPYNNDTIIGHLVNTICSAGFEEVIVVTGHESEKIKKAVSGLPVNVIYNSNYKDGITTSIQKGISHSNEKAFMICLADMIKITAGEYYLIKRNFENQFLNNPETICVPRYNNQKGNPVVFSSSYKEAILLHKNMNGCSDVVQANSKNINWVNMPTDSILQDVDIYSDYLNLT